MALKGQQGGHATYTCALTLADLLAVLPPADRSAPPEKRAQRPLVEKRACALADYLKRANSYTLPALTVSARSIEFKPLGAGFIGQVTVPVGALDVLCNDGQHRRRAIEIALETHPHLATDTVTVVFYEDVDLCSMQQRFADLNSAQPVARSARLLYDLRRSSRARDAALRPPFAGLVEMQAANALPSSDKLWTLSGLDKTPNVERTDFWSAFFAAQPALAELRAGALPAKDVRRRFVWAHNVGIQGIGLVADKVSVEQLIAVDWFRDSIDWEGRAQRAGKMLATRKNAVLIACQILQKFDVPLPPQFVRVENAHRTEVATAMATAGGTASAPVVLYQPPAPRIAIINRASLGLGEWAKFYATGPFAYGDVPSFAGISGGRTSALMAALLDPRVRLCFENTGREKKVAHDFLLRLADALKREIVWLEWRPPERRGAPPSEFGFAIVNDKTCVKHDPRDPMAGGVLFDGLLKALAEYRATKGEGPVVPYFSMRVCTIYLKHRVQQAYMESLGVKRDHDQIQYIGLRTDEPDRLSNLRSIETAARSLLTPLAEAGIVKADVNAFWRRQAFDLEIAHDRDGNCTGCFLKDDADLSRTLGDPETDAAWWIDVQRRYPGFGGKEKYSYAQLLAERPTRLAVEVALRDGHEPVQVGDAVTPRRFKLIVQNERRQLAGEGRSFACACESALAVADSEDVA